MEKICMKRQDLIIKTKVQILEQVRRCNPKHDQESIDLLFWLFDLMPSLEITNQCADACSPCRFPHCAQAKPIMDIVRAARDTRFLKVHDASRCRTLWMACHGTQDGELRLPLHLT